MRRTLGLLLLAMQSTACAAAMRGCFSSRGDSSLLDQVEPIPDEPPLVLGACAGIGGSHEPCRATAPVGALEPGSRRERLLVLLPGDEGDCGLFARSMRDLAAEGSLPVCIDLHETLELTTSAAVPLRAERARAAIAELAGTTAVRAAWTGEDLVLAGEGISASVWVVAATEAAAPLFPRGARHTSACLFDGSYDATASRDALLRGGPGGHACIPRGPTIPAMRRWCPDAPTTGGEVTPERCGSALAEVLAGDSVLPIDPTALEVDDLVVVDCGSELSTCTGDVFPAEPADRFCRAVDSRGPTGEGTPRCVRESVPGTPHGRCVATALPTCFERLAAVAAAPPGPPPVNRNPGS